jgi:hypothetical protein
MGGRLRVERGRNRGNVSRRGRDIGNGERSMRRKAGARGIIIDMKITRDITGRRKASTGGRRKGVIESIGGMERRRREGEIEKLGIIVGMGGGIGMEWMRRGVLRDTGRIRRRRGEYMMIGCMMSGLRRYVGGLLMRIF